MAIRSEDESASLFYRYREGDPSAFQELFNKHKRGVINLSYRFVRDQSTAEDIAQDVFIKIYEKRATFEPKAKFTTWLYRITVNASIDFLRKKSRSDRSLDESRTDDAGTVRTLLETMSDPAAVVSSEALILDETKQLVRAQIDKLPENLKSPILLYQFDDLSYDEIAKILGISVKAVERRIYHAKNALRQALLQYLR